MFKPYKDGTIEVIQHIECHLPKVGYIYNPITNKEEYIGVYMRSKQRNQQYWERDKNLAFTLDWDKECRKEGILPEEHPEYKKHLEKWWKYRLGGFWFYNNGIPTYITGANWYYLSVYSLDVGYPKYRDIDKQYFYLWKWVQENPNCYGLTEITKRRSGKSFRAGAISLEESSRKDNFMVGIQSKTDEDAAKFFKKNIVNPFRKLPLCFKPNSNLPASGKAPQSELKFENPKMDDLSDELMSAIDYQSSTIGAYDGQKLGLYVGDESGKLIGVNVNDRWDIVKFCLRDEEGNIIGKTIHTSTVEKERTKSGKTKQDDDTCDKNFLEMWNKSNQEKIGEDGSTESGLIRFFIGGDYTRYLDKHGFADREKGYKAIMAEREKLKDSPRALANLIRKEPLTDREAFQADGDTCIFGNPVMIQSRYDDLMFLPKQYKEGNFHWVDGKKDGDVYFEECENGRFWVAYEPEEGHRNRIKSRTYSDIPDNKEHFCAGIDPFDYKIVQNGNTKGLSKGSLCIVKKDNPLKPTRFDNGVACLYLQRPPLPETFYEDCIKALKYYGCEALIERNKGDIIKYMKERGYEEFVAWLPDQPERGIYNASRESGGGVNGMLTEVIDQWIGGGVDNVVFPMLLSQLLEFDPTNTTKFDAAMSYGYALLLYKTTIRQFNRKNKSKSISGFDVSGWF